MKIHIGISSLLAGILILSGCASTGRQGRQEFSKHVSESVAANPVSEEERIANLPPPPPPVVKPEKRFDLVLRNAPVHQAYMSLVEGTGWSIILPKTMQGDVTLTLRDTTISDVLETLRETHGYEYRVEGRRIIVEDASETKAKVFRIFHPVQRRTGRSETRILSGSVSDSGSSSGQTNTNSSATTSTSGGSQRSVESSRVQTDNKENFWEEIVETIKGAMGQGNGRTVTASPQAGIIVVRGDPTDLRNAERIIRSTQDNISKQVLIESKIIDVQLGDGNRNGINWASFDASGRTRWSMNANSSNIDYASGRPVADAVLSSVVPAVAASSGVGGALGLAFRTGSFLAMMEFLQTQGSARVLSSPRIAAINNQKALLKIGTDEYFVTNVSNSQTSTSSGTTNTPSVTTQPFFSGIALDITPQIDDDNNVTLHIHPSVSNVTTVQKQIDLGSSGSYVLPLAASSISETDSVVRIQDGQVAAIGGLFSMSRTDETNKIPGAGDIPAGGLLFRDDSGKGTKRELVVLVKATIIKDKSDWEAQMDIVRNRLSSFDRNGRGVEITNPRPEDESDSQSKPGKSQNRRS